MPEPLPPCGACGATDVAPMFSSWNGYPIVRCVWCGLVATDDRGAPPPETLYPAFDQSDTSAQRSVRGSLALFLRQRASFVKEVTTLGATRPRLLDYGCGSGAFARHMAGDGYEVVGLEPFSLGASTREQNLTLVRRPIAEARAELGGAFDVITLWHVLEHVHSPVEVLVGLRELLAPGGVIVVSVPNFASIQSRVFGGAWFHLDPPRHVIHFNRATLGDVLGRAGLAPFTEKPFLPEYGTSGWVQSALNRVLPHKNYLFELAKDRGALAGMSRASSALHLAASIALGAPVFAASLPIEAISALGNRAAALTVAARVT
jgi:SAM-dependent methyltransferase